MDAKEEAAKRALLTRYLLLAGGAILVIPLLIILYLRSTETSSANPGGFSHPFAHRERVSDRIKAALTPAPASLPAPAAVQQALNAAAASASDSLGFIKGGSDYLPAAKTAAEPVQAQTAPPPAAAQPLAQSAPPAKSKPKSKPGAKPFMQPHLQGSGFKNTAQRGGQASQLPGGTAMPDISKMMQGAMPGGTGMPDISKMMQGTLAAPAAGTTNKQ
jgi:hypothetical protein